MKDVSNSIETRASTDSYTPALEMRVLIKEPDKPLYIATRGEGYERIWSTSGHHDLFVFALGTETDIPPEEVPGFYFRMDLEGDSMPGPTDACMHIRGYYLPSGTPIYEPTHMKRGRVVFETWERGTDAATGKKYLAMSGVGFITLDDDETIMSVPFSAKVELHELP